MTYNNHTLGLASQEDCKLTSPQRLSQSAIPVSPRPGSRPPAQTSSVLDRRPALPPAHQANPGTRQPLPLAPSGPWSRSADPSGSTLNGCGLVAILLHLFSCHSSFQTVKHCACAVHCAAKSRPPRGQSVRMRRRKTLSTSPPNTNPF